MLPTPPVTAVHPTTETLHGDTRIDDYRWLRDRENPDVLRHLEAENAYAQEVFAPLAPVRDALYAEMLGRIKQTDMNAPYRDGAYWYYVRTEEGAQYPIYCRRNGTLEAPEEVILDENVLSRGHAFFALGAMRVSPDGALLAYAADTDGSETYDLYVKDLSRGANLPERLHDVASVAWCSDNATLLYVTRDAAKRPHRLWRHRLGAVGATDELLYEEANELFTLGAWRSKSGAYIIVQSSSGTADEVRCLDAAAPGGELRLLLARSPEVEYAVGHHGNVFYILTNDGARNFRLMKAPVEDPARGRWTEVVAHRDDVTLEGMELFAGHLVLFERAEGLQRMRVLDLADGGTHDIALPEPVYAAFNGTNRVWETRTFRFSYQSFITPASVYDYDLATRERVLVKQQEVLGGFDPSAYSSERVVARAPDGTEVPISLVCRKGTPRDGSAPFHLTGYGAYGISEPVLFSSNRLSLLDRGVTVGIAHVRGGGEMGRSWKDDGRMLRKRNTFTDFIACAEHLIAARYTSPARLTIEGGSAGGLLVGAVLNMRPDLFRAALAQVPFVDVLNTMLDPNLPLTVGEYLEWGNPNEKEYYDCIRSYCPYTNVRAQAYPPLLVRVGLNDPRVSYWEGAKWVARLRAVKTDANPVLLVVNMGAGHRGSSGRYDRLKEIAFDYAYILSQNGALTSAPQGM
jgi:oligopeptidase B